MSLTRYQLLNAVTSNPWTRNFRHLLPFPRTWLKRTSRADPAIKSVSPKQRIKWWNIVPGDSIGLRGDASGTVHEVLAINKFSNRVFLKGINEDQTKEGKLPPSKNVHYSQCQLYIGRMEYAPSEFKSVFVKRIKMSTPRWIGNKWHWERQVAKAIPEPPNWYSNDNPSPTIAWPKPQDEPKPRPGLYDTLEENVREVTYKVPESLSAQAILEKPRRLESDYLQHLYNPQITQTFDSSLPVEIFLENELSSPHSRAKKQARWQAKQQYERALHEDILSEELKNLKGRNKQEARAEATFKWKQQIDFERRVDKERRRRSQKDIERGWWKADERQKRQRRKAKRLEEMVLENAPNQVIPGGSSSLPS